MKVYKAIAVVFVLCLIPAATSALTQTQEQDGIWVTKEAYVALEGITVQEAKDLARQKARDMAIEEAVGSFIKGSTIVYNYQLAEDIVSSLRRGIIVAEEVLNEGFVTPEGKGQSLVYNVTLRLKVKPVPIEGRKGFTVSLTLNRQVFRVGENVEIRVKPTEDSYIYIFNIFQHDMVTLLIPNRHLTNNYVKANTELVFPGAGLNKHGIGLAAFLPAGATRATERVKVIATKKRIEFFDKEIKEAIFKEFDGRSDTLIVNIYQALALQEPAEWTEAVAVYEIRK
ncbi:MAG: DUF4384 domain-containing protein [Nitrospirota bacterium]